MPQYEAPGGGIIDAGDKRIERKVVVSTGGNLIAPGGSGRLTNVSVTEEAGGIRRGVYEYTIGGQGDATYNIYGVRIELLGGSREVPIETHPIFNDLTTEEIAAVQRDVEEKKQAAYGDEAQTLLYNCLIKKVESYLVPSIVARVSEIESNLPNLDDLTTIASPQGVGNIDNSIWVLTGISATPLGDKYEVTREYTSVPNNTITQELYGA
jgi:hypothetical protein